MTGLRLMHERVVLYSCPDLCMSRLDSALLCVHRKADPGELPTDRRLTVQNEIPKTEFVSVFCGMDTVERRCGHVGRKVFSESLFCLSPPSGRPEQREPSGPSRGGLSGQATIPEAATPPTSFLSASPFYKKVYFHADILQARSLPAMDNDALVNPWWSLEVEGEVSSYS